MNFKKLPRIVCAILIMTPSLSAFPANAATCKRDVVECLPTAERDVFILDISDSNDVSANWKNSLRPSILEKLRQPFGFPDGREKTQIARAPSDISIGVISSNSANEPLAKIVTVEDAREIWDLIKKVGINPNAERLKQIYDDIFGGKGAYTELAQSFNQIPLKIQNASQCNHQVATNLEKSLYLGRIDAISRANAAQGICKVYLRIMARLISIDEKFENPKCQSARACSDIMGAILKASKAAEDLSNQARAGETSPKLCIAIASDMMHFSPNMKPGSFLNSRRIAETAKSLEEAKLKGAQAASGIGIQFPRTVATRIFVLGEGTGPDPLPLERTSFLNAYWSGFWTQSGINSQNQAKSLDSACNDQTDKGKR